MHLLFLHKIKKNILVLYAISPNRRVPLEHSYKKQVSGDWFNHRNVRHIR